MAPKSTRSINDIVRDIKKTPEQGALDNKGKGAGEIRAQLSALIENEDSKRAYRKRQWELCLAFLEGLHWLKRDRANNRTLMPESPSERKRHRARVTYNKIQQAVDNRVAKFIQGQPTFRARPQSDQVKHKQAAKVAEALLKHEWERLDLDRKYTEVMYWTTISQGYLEFFIDNTKGDTHEYVLDPVTNEPEPLFSKRGEELVKDGAQIETAFAGEIGCQVVSPFELYFFGDKDPQEAFAVAKRKGYTQDQVEERWNKKIEPTFHDDFNLARDPGRSHDTNDLVVVTEWFIPPCKAADKGLYLVYADNEELYSGDYPYESGRIPFFKFSGSPHPSNDYDSSFVYNLLPIQKELNVVLSQIVEYKTYSLYPGVFVPKGFGKNRVYTNEPGQVWEYEVHPGAKDQGLPQERTSPPLPPYVYELVNVLIEGISDISGEHKITQGDLPGRVDNATAIGLLKEQEITPIRPYAKLHARSLSAAGMFILELAKQIYHEERFLEIVGPANVNEIRAFTGKDLDGVADVVVDPDHLLPRSVAAKDSDLKELFELGAITKEEFLENKNSLGVDGISEHYRASKQRASLEIANLRETGQPIPDPLPSDIDAAHVEVMNVYANSEEFLLWPEEKKTLFFDHYTKHADSIQAQQQAELVREITKFNFATQLKGPADPEVISSLLSSAGGIDVPAETLAANEDAFNEERQDSRVEQLRLKSELKLLEEESKAALKKQQAEFESQLVKQQELFKAELERQLMVAKGEIDEKTEARQTARDIIIKNNNQEGEDGGLKVIPVVVPKDQQEPIQAPAETATEMPAEDPTVLQELEERVMGEQALSQEALPTEETLATEPALPVEEEPLPVEAPVDMTDEQIVQEGLSAGGLSPEGMTEELSPGERFDQALAETPSEDQLPPEGGEQV